MPHNSKIIKGLSKYNFEYRVVRHPDLYLDKTQCEFEGEKQYIFRVQEVWFTGLGEINGYCASTEDACDSGPLNDLYGLEYQVKDIYKAIRDAKKNNDLILDIDFIKDQIKRVRRRERKEIKKGIEPNSMLGRAMFDKEQITEATVRNSQTIENESEDYFTQIDKRSFDRYAEQWEKETELMSSKIRSAVDKTLATGKPT